ncbi:MAG TPA: PDZ domain-containing protein [Bryobacteraceae bacterium]|nr:PDZ domain-containing protein [Bryobacteraceae bacterium]
MKTVFLSGLCLTGMMTSALVAQNFAPAPSRARAATRRVAIQHGSSYLGVGVVEIDADRAKALRLKDDYGVEVKCVDAESPAAKAGLKEGDVVLEYNGQRVEGGEQFMRLVRETPPGHTATLLISRNGATQTLTASIGQRHSGTMAFEFDDDSFAMAMPATPPMPAMPPMPAVRIPDFPRAFMTWRSPTLGIESESLNPQLAEFFGVKEGVLVRSVMRDSTAEKAGFKAGDVIVKVDGEKVSTPKEISSILQSSRSKKTLPVTVVRHQKEVVLTVSLEESSRWPAYATGEML